MLFTLIQAFTRSLRLLRDEMRGVVTVGICSLLAAACTACYAALAGPIAAVIWGDDVGGEPTSNWLAELPLWVGGSSRFVTVATFLTALFTVALVRALAKRCLQVENARIEQAIAHQLRMQLHDHALRVVSAGVGTLAAGRDSARIVHEIGEVRQLVSLGYGQLLQQVLLALCLAGVAFWADPAVSVVVIIGLVGTLSLLNKPVRETRVALKGAMEAQASLTGVTAEVLAEVELIRLYEAEAYARSRFRTRSLEVRDRIVGAVTRHSRVYPILEMLLFASLVAGGLWAAVRIEEGLASAEGYVTLFSALFLMIRPIRALVGMSHPLAGGLAALDRLDAFLGLPVEGGEATDASLPSDPAEVKFEGVSVFGEERPRLHGVDLAIQRGEAIAVVGASGAGKTTLLKVLMGLLPHDHGKLTADGVAIQDASPAVWRRLFSWVPQRPRLLSGSVLANITMGDDEPDLQRVHEAAAQAGAAKFIEALPEGYDTVLLEAGRDVSVGEAQRICLARALYRAAPILVLDEPTSALDREAEHRFLGQLERLLGSRTIIMTSHRAAGMIPVDRVVVLDDGRIVDDGSPHDFIRQSGTFRSLFDRD